MNKVLPIVLLSSLSTFSSVASDSESIDIAELVVDKTKDAILGQFESLLSDAIFGGQVNYATLSEESLREIEDIVNSEIVDAAEFEVIAGLESLGDTIEYYSASVNYGNPDFGVLDEAIVKTNDLSNHQAFNDDFNDDFYYLTESYVLAGSLTISIYTEQHLQGYIPASFVSTRAIELASKLEDMVNARKAVEWPLEERCNQISSQYDQYDLEKCTLKTKDGILISSRTVADDDNEWQKWDDLVDNKTDEYYEATYNSVEDIVEDWRGL